MEYYCCKVCPFKTSFKSQIQGHLVNHHSEVKTIE